MWKSIIPFVALILSISAQTGTSGSNCKEKATSLTSLEMAMESIGKAKSLYPNCSDSDDGLDTPGCSKKDKSFAFLEIATNLISQALDSYPSCNDSKPLKPLIVNVTALDCTDVLKGGHKKSGVYTVWPSLLNGRSLDVYCDMDTDGGGWTVIQRRGDFPTQQDFYQNWKNYKNGFGNITRDFWIGNDNIFALTNQSKYEARFDLGDFNDNRAFALYKNFWIEDEKTSYKLHIGSYSGTAGDSMENQNEQQFSTNDRKNDKTASYGEGCAEMRQGGWWYKDCGDSNLNGNYRLRSDYKNVYWRHWKEYNSLAFVEIKLRRI